MYLVCSVNHNHIYVICQVNYTETSKNTIRHYLKCKKEDLENDSHGETIFQVFIYTKLAD